jgi:hypothetical protein
MDKKKFMLRLDEEVYRAIEKWAADEFRSVNGQMEWMLNHVLKLHKRKHSDLPDNPEETNEPEL